MTRIAGLTRFQKILAMTTLTWVTYATGLLTESELLHALAVDVGDSDLDQDKIPDIELVISVCAGLVTVDEQSGVVRLVHQTAQEYLERTQSKWFPDAETRMDSQNVHWLPFVRSI